MTRLERLEEIRKRAEKATEPAPEEAYEHGWYQLGVRTFVNDTPTGWFPMTEENTAFYLRAREDIPWLLAEVARMQDALEQLSEGHDASCRTITMPHRPCNCSMGIARVGLGMEP